MKLFSYYVECPGLNAETELRLAVLWRRVWSDLGIEPIILNEWHARQHPLYANLDAAVSKFPSSNPAAYERACYLRWLALGVVGGGWLADLDLMPGIEPLRTLAEIHNVIGNKEVITLQGACPCLSYATTKGVELLAKEFMTKGQRPHGDKGHWSDMYAIEDTNADWLSKQSVVKLYSEAGWETAPFIHFSNSTTASKKIPRHQLIPSVLPRSNASTL